jgi:hypothetical protein
VFELRSLCMLGNTLALEPSLQPFLIYVLGSLAFCLAGLKPLPSPTYASCVVGVIGLYYYTQLIC